MNAALNAMQRQIELFYNWRVQDSLAAQDASAPVQHSWLSNSWDVWRAYAEHKGLNLGFFTASGDNTHTACFFFCGGAE